MKNIIEYISENTVSANSKNVSTKAILIERNVDCGNLTEDEFVEMVYDDLTEAKEKYDASAKEAEIEWCRRESEIKRNDHYRFASQKWKTEEKRMKYVNDKISKASNTCKYNHPTEVHIDTLNPSYSSSTIIELGTSNMKNSIRMFWKDLEKNEYFKSAKGWEIYFYTENDLLLGKRFEMKFYLDKKDEKKFKSDRNEIGKKIEDFYKDTKYWGD